MKIRIINRASLLAVVLFASLQIAAASDAEGSFSKTLKVTGATQVDVTTGSGNITVKAGDSSTVVIYAKIRANDGWFRDSGLSAQEKVKRIESNPPIEQVGNMITIGKIEDRDLRNNVSISYEVSVPASTKLRSHTGSGDQTISGINGTVRADTGSGNVKATQLGDETRVSTGSGDVRLDSVKGRVYANTGSGNVEAFGVSGGFVGETGSGDITFEQAAAGDVTAKTGSGNIRVKNVKGGLDAHTGSGDIEAEGDAKGDWIAHSGSGSITLRLPPNASFTVDARSSSGGIHVNHPVTVQGEVKKNRLQGKVGNGGVLLSLESGSGSIRVE